MSKSAKKFQPNQKGRYSTMAARDRKIAKVPTNKTLNTKIKRIQRNVEIKHKDYEINGSAVTTTGLLLDDHNFVQEGDTNITREGAIIRATSLQFIGRFTTDGTILDTATRIRMIVFWDSQTNGAVPNLSGVNGILDVLTIDGLTFSPRQTNTLKRYKVIYDKIYTVNPQLDFVRLPATGTITANVKVHKPFRLRFKLSRAITYSGNAGTIADLVSNGIYIFCMSDSDTVGVSGGIRLYFKDA